MSYDRIIQDALRLARAPRRFALGGEADPKDISPSISNSVSVFPKPQRMFPSDAPVPGGQYLGMPDKQDMTGHKSAVASIGVHPGGKPYFNASRDAVDQTGTAGKAKTKTNLFKQKAGWSWQTAPEGHEDTNTIVSVEHRGKHYYTLNAHFPKGVDFARYAESKSEPRLRPTTTGDVFLGPQAGTISVRGKEHPVYHHVVVKADGGAVGYASGGDVDQPRKLDDMGFYSSAAESARFLPQSKGTPQQMLATMKGVKPAELEWSGVQDKFAGQKSVTKDDLAQHFEQNVPEIKETVLGGKREKNNTPTRQEVRNEFEAKLLHYNDIDEKYNSMIEDGKGHLLTEKDHEEYQHALSEMDRLTMELHERLEEIEGNEYDDTKYSEYTVGNRYGNTRPSQRNYREVLLHLPGEKKFQSAHWDPANIVAHLRMQDRGPDNNILHLEELQSDWAQQGRDKGFYTKDMEEKRKSALNEFRNYSKYLADKYGLNPQVNFEMYFKLKNMTNDEVNKYKNLYRESFKMAGLHKNYIQQAPYVTNTDHWVELGLKRALLEAARGGYDKLVWTPGEEQAKRFDLSRHVDRVEYNPYNKKFNAYKDGNKVIAERGVEQDKIKNYIGSELAEKLNNKIKNQMAEDSDLIARVNNLITKDTNVDMLYDSLSSRYGLEGLDLKVGGEGMKSFYDKMLPSALRRVLKPHTDKIQPTSHVVKGNDGEDVTLSGIEITPELRESILKKGFSYYARGGEVRQHFEVGGGAAGGDSDASGGGFGDSGGGGDSAPEATQDSPAFSTTPAFSTDAPPSYSPPESDPSMLGGATGMAFSSPGSGSLGVGTGNTSGSFLGTAEQQLNTGPGIVGFIGGTPLGLVALGAEKLNEAARAQGYDVVDPGGARPGRGTEQAAREQAAYEAGFPGNRSGGNDSGMIPDPLAPEPSFYGFRLSNDDEETQAGMVKPVGFAPPPPPVPAMAEGGAVPMASGGETGDTQSMPQLTSEQQSLLDQLSRAIDRVYPAMDAAEARQPVIRHEPTMPGEPALTTEQHQEYNIGQLQNALARVPTDYPTGPVGYAEGGDVGDNPAVQKALSLTAGQNQPVLRSTFALENQPSATVSPRPGKGGGPPITHPSENFDPSLITEQKPWTYATPDIIGAPKPPPVQHPVLNEPRMKNIVRRTSKIFGDKNFQKLIKDFTGLEGITATPIVGSWEGEVEPSFVIKHPNMNSEQAKKIAHLLGFGFQQDSVVHTHANPHIDEGIPTVLIGKNQKLSKEEIDQIAHHSINNGLDFSITSDGTAAKYLDFGGPEKHHEFLEKIKKIADATKMNEIYHAFSEGELKNAKDYLTVIFGGAGEEAGLQDRPQRSPDLFRRIVDHVLAPYAKAVASEGYRLSPERLQEAYGLTDDEADYVRSAMRPSGRVDRTTIPLMTKEEKLDIRPTGSRGNPTVEDVLWALQNRAAAKGQIDPEDYSKDAMKKIASDIAKEVDYHVKSSNLGGQKSAIGWYDGALKSAMNVYSSQFPQLAKNKNDRMLFHAILGITSQGNDVYSNSLNAVRVFDLMKNKGFSLANAVKKLSGTFGDKTKAIEMNLLKFDHLINKNGYDAMRDFFNKKATASEINKILRTNKNLHGPSGSPLDVEGQKDQIVSGWSVFGPKIGSFINNLHGDYSTLTADLWFSRTWNRLLGHGFIHTPLTEAKQYRDLRDAMIAEYNHHNGLPHEQVPYVQNGKIDPNKSWLHGSDLKNISHDDFHDLINDPDRMLEFAKNAFESYKGGSFKEKSDVRRRAKNWIENRELPVAAPRSDLERSFQQNTAEEAKKILKKKYGVDISVADIQAALWFHEKELFDRLGVASKKSKPADYADAAKQTMDLINSGKLYEVKSREKKSQKASGGSVVDQALRLVSKYGSLPGDAVSLSRHLIQRGRP